MGKKKAASKKTALVIIHLSSLDSFTDLEYMATGERDDSYALAWQISQAVNAHQGPIIIVDQMWLFIGKESGPRTHFLEDIGVDFDDYQEWGSDQEKSVHEQEDPRKITWIKFDEQDQDWDEFLALLEEILKELKVTDVLLGGLFYEHDLSEGCVTHTYKFLRDRIPTKVELHLVGDANAHCEPDDQGNLPGGYTAGGKP